MTDAELSEAVAVEVMGWLDDTERGGAPKTTWAFWRVPEQKGDLGTFWHFRPPSYATDIAAAMEVFEKISVDPNNTHFLRRCWPNGDLAAPRWAVLSDKNGWVDWVGVSVADTLSRAICEAALLWARSRDA